MDQLSVGQHAERTPRETYPGGPCVGPLIVGLREFAAQQEVLPDVAVRVGRYALMAGEVGDMKIPGDIPATRPNFSHNSFEAEDVEALKKLLLESLKSKDPGAVRLLICDLTNSGALRDFTVPLGGLAHVVGPRKLSEVTDRLLEQQLKLSNSDAKPGTELEPWTIGVIIGGDGQQPADREFDDMMAIINSKTSGVSLYTAGVDLAPSSNLADSWGEGWKVVPDTVPPETIREACEDIARVVKEGAKPPALDSVIPELPTDEQMKRSTRDGLVATIGVGSDGKPVKINLNSHMYWLGKTGSGKTVGIRTLLESLAQEYPPSELQFVLADLKHGTGLNAMAPNEGSADADAYDAHTRLLATNIDDDVAMQEKVLQHLLDEMKERADAMRLHGVTELEQLRGADNSRDYPTLVAVLDEFQVLLQGKDSGDTSHAVAMLEKILRQGRSLGVRLVLCSQAVSGIEGLYGKRDMFRNVGIEVIGSGGVVPTGVEDKTEHAINQRAAELPPMRVLVRQTTDDGTGRIPPPVEVRLPAAYEGPELAARRRHRVNVLRQRGVTAQRPRVFDGDEVPALATAPEIQNFEAPAFVEPTQPVEIGVGRRVDFGAQAATLKLQRRAGSNLAVVGDPEDTARIVQTAAVTYAKQRSPEHAKFAVVCLDPTQTAAANQMAAALKAEGHSVEPVTSRQAQAYFERVGTTMRTEDSDQSQIIVVYGADTETASMVEKPVVQLPVDDTAYDLKVRGFGETVRKGTPIALPKGEAGGKPVAAPFAGRVEVDNEVGEDGELHKVVRVYSNTTGRDAMRQVLQNGGVYGVHVLATYGDASRLKETCGHSAADVAQAHTLYAVCGTDPSSLPGGPYNGQLSQNSKSNRAVVWNTAGRGAEANPAAVAIYQL